MVGRLQDMEVLRDVGAVGQVDVEVAHTLAGVGDRASVRCTPGQRAHSSVLNCSSVATLAERVGAQRCGSTTSCAM